MNIQSHSPNFTATYIKQVEILKNNQPVKASLVELTKEEDKDDINKITYLWQSPIITLLSNDLDNKSKMNEIRKIFAVSAQNEHLGKIIPEKVLGIFEMRDKGEKYELEYLEVKPSSQYKKENREYSGIGKVCMDYIKSEFNDKDVTINAIPGVIPFYKEMGCVKDTSSSSIYRYLIPQKD